MTYVMFCLFLEISNLNSTSILYLSLLCITSTSFVQSVFLCILSKWLRNSLSLSLSFLSLSSLNLPLSHISYSKSIISFNITHCPSGRLVSMGDGQSEWPEAISRQSSLPGDSVRQLYTIQSTDHQPCSIDGH